MSFELLVNRWLESARRLRGRRVETATPSAAPVPKRPVQKTEGSG